MTASRRTRLRPLCFAVSLACVDAHAAAPASDGGVVDAVTITAVRAQGFVPRSVSAGSFRGADVMDVPSTVNVITREVLELQAAAGLYDALRNSAGVTRQQNGGDTWDQLVIRGIAVENRTNYRLNGSVPVMNFSQVPMENKERVEVLKGASALYYGFTSPAGVVNFVTKRAVTSPVTSAGVRLDDQGTAIANVDIGRRFGAQQQVGVRLNAAGGALGSFLDRPGTAAAVSPRPRWTGASTAACCSKPTWNTTAAESPNKPALRCPPPSTGSSPCRARSIRRAWSVRTAPASTPPAKASPCAPTTRWPRAGRSRSKPAARRWRANATWRFSASPMPPPWPLAPAASPAMRKRPWSDRTSCARNCSAAPAPAPSSMR